MLHLIASTMARGGFSGGVVLDHSGIALALVTESLGKMGMPVETGYMSLMSIEPAVNLAVQKFGFDTHGANQRHYSDVLIAEKFTDPSRRSLSSFIYDAGLHVYDDDRDVLVEISCVDEAVLAKAVTMFHAITPIIRNELDDGTVLYTPAGNPSSELLTEAGEAVAAFFLESGYRKMVSDRNRWHFGKA